MNALQIQFEPSPKPADAAAFERGREALVRLAVERVLRRRGMLSDRQKPSQFRARLDFDS